MSYAGPSDLALQRVGLIRYAEDTTGTTIPDACFQRPWNENGGNSGLVNVPQFTAECLSAILGTDGSHVLGPDDLVKVVKWSHDNWQNIHCSPETAANGSCDESAGWSSVVETYYKRVWEALGLEGKPIEGQTGTYDQGKTDLGGLLDSVRFLLDPSTWLALVAGIVGLGMIVYGGSRVLR